MSSLPHPALLVIDLQVGLLHGPEAPHAGAETLANINRLSQAARAAGAPVLAVRHTGPAGSPIAAGSPFWQLAPELVVDEADRVFDKHRPNAFHGTGLDGWLKEGGVQTLIVTGMKTQYCIDTTCRAAADLGYAVVLVSDAHTCMDTPQLAATQIIAHHNATLAGPFVRLMSSDELCEALSRSLQPG
ncbi:cysteine hydrolase family protein [Aeromonas rivipollensis]|uniref:cysteine hydrolase family protein n=1 Tax=Aeromonas rivipollensis TaxID=948519 RepID=UPI0039892FDA